MRRLFILSALFGATALMSAAHAQNYIQPRNYASPGVVVNMDVVGNSFGNYQPTPVYQRPLPPPEALIRLTPPSATHEPMQIAAPVAMPASRQAPPITEEMMVPPVPSPMARTAAPSYAGTTPSPKEMQARTLLAETRKNVEGSKASARSPVIFDEPVKTSSRLSDDLDGTQIAALPPSRLPDVAPAAIPPAPHAAQDDFEAYRLMFDGGSTELKSSEQAVLDKIINKMTSDNAVRLQLRAYANGTPDTTAQARRTSLARALKVRSYLVDKGITATRLDVRALGMGTTMAGDAVSNGKAPADRVDAIFVR